MPPHFLLPKPRSEEEAEELRRYGFWYSCFSVLMAIIVISLLIVNFTVYSPQLNVTSFSISISGFNSSAPMTAKGTVNFSVKNTCWSYPLVFQSVRVSLFYNDVVVSDALLPPFGRDAWTASPENAAFGEKVVDERVARALVGHMVFNETVNFCVEMRTHIRLVDDSQYNYALRFHCDKMVAHFVMSDIRAEKATLVSNGLLDVSKCKSTFDKVG